MGRKVGRKERGSVSGRMFKKDRMKEESDSGYKNAIQVL